MQQSGNYFQIKGLLKGEKLEQLEAIAKNAVFDDGKATASGPARELKHNLQARMNTMEYNTMQQLLMMAINENQEFRNVTLAKQVYPFLFSKYTPGMEYGWHVDSPLMGNMLRTDIAMTVFLNEPSEYEGGELELQSPVGSMLYKLPKGDAICYPCTQLHRVRPVTSGERRVAVTWIESVVKDNACRNLLFEISRVQDSLLVKDLHSPEAAQLMQIHSNLLRMWS